MSFTSKCPRCHQLVTIPDGLDPEHEVRCPLCVAVYPLCEALAEAPPALIAVDGGAAQGPGPDSHAALKSDLDADPPGIEAEPSADQPHALDAPRKTDAGLGIDTAPADHPLPAIDTGQASVDTDALAALSVQQSDDDSGPDDLGAGTRPGRRKKGKGAIRFLAEVFGGGVLGLLIGYYVLCWILGPENRLPKLPLPLLPHTMEDTIDWFKGEREPDNSPPQPSPAGPGNPRREPQPQPRSPQPGPTEDDAGPPDVPPVGPPAEPSQPE